MPPNPAPNPLTQLEEARRRLEEEERASKLPSKQRWVQALDQTACCPSAEAAGGPAVGLGGILNVATAAWGGEPACSLAPVLVEATDPQLSRDR